MLTSANVIGPVWSVIHLSVGHPLAGLAICAAALLLVARPGKSSYRA